MTTTTTTATARTSTFALLWAMMTLATPWVHASKGVDCRERGSGDQDHVTFACVKGRYRKSTHPFAEFTLQSRTALTNFFNANQDSRSPREIDNIFRYAKIAMRHTMNNYFRGLETHPPGDKCAPLKIEFVFMNLNEKSAEGFGRMINVHKGYPTALFNHLECIKETPSWETDVKIVVDWKNLEVQKNLMKKSAVDNLPQLLEALTMHEMGHAIGIGSGSSFVDDMGKGGSIDLGEGYERIPWEPKGHHVIWHSTDNAMANCNPGGKMGSVEIPRQLGGCRQKIMYRMGYRASADATNQQRHLDRTITPFLDYGAKKGGIRKVALSNKRGSTYMSEGGDFSFFLRRMYR